MRGVNWRIISCRKINWRRGSGKETNDESRRRYGGNQKGMKGEGERDELKMGVKK